MRIGDILYFWGEDTSLLVVGVSDSGVRVYDTSTPKFEDNGSLKTHFVTYEVLDEACSYISNIDEVVNSNVNREDVKVSEGSNDVLRDSKVTIEAINILSGDERWT